MLKWILIGTIVLLVSIVVIAANTGATIYCVKNTGDNGYSGVYDGDFDAAWETIEYAMSPACGISGDDTCYIYSERYTNNSMDNPGKHAASVGIICSTTGSAGHPILYQGYPGMAVLDGGGGWCADTVGFVQKWQYGILWLTSGVVNAYVTLKNIRVVNVGSPDSLDGMWPEAHGFYIRGRHIGINFYNCQAETILTTGGNTAGGWSFAGAGACSVVQCTVRYVYNTKGFTANRAGFNGFGGSDAPGDTVYDIVIQDCYVEGSEQGVQMKSYVCRNWTVDSSYFENVGDAIRCAGWRNDMTFNVIRNCLGGILVRPDYGFVAHNWVYNNTVYCPDQGFTGPDWYCVYRTCPDKKDIGQNLYMLDANGTYNLDSCYFFNNICWKDASSTCASEPSSMALRYSHSAPHPDTHYIDYNCYYDSTAPNCVVFFGGAYTWGNWQATNHDTNSDTTDPLFTDPDNGDFSLQSGSWCRTGGRGGAYVSYLGAIDPEAEAPITKRKLLGGVKLRKGRL